MFILCISFINLHEFLTMILNFLYFQRMPRLKKRKGDLARRPKYYYRRTKTEAFEFTEGSFRLITDETAPSSLPSDHGSILDNCDNEIARVQSEEQILPTNETLETVHQYTQTVETEYDHLYSKSATDTKSSTDTFNTGDVTAMFNKVDNEMNNGDESATCDVDIECEEVVVQAVAFKDLASDIKKSVESKEFTVCESEMNITLIKFYDGEIPSVKLLVKIDKDFICTVCVHRRTIDRSHQLWEGMPPIFDRVDIVERLLDRLKTLKVCCGNLEEEYSQLLPVGCVLTNNVDEGPVAYREGDFGAISEIGEAYSSTVRSTKCSLLTTRRFKCMNCTNYGYALKKRTNTLRERTAANKSFSHSSFKHKDMTRDELCKKLREQKSEIDSLQNTVRQLKRKFEKEIQTVGVSVKDHEHMELSDLMSSCTGDFNKAFPNSSSRQRLFWEQQFDCIKKSDKRGMCWHPMIIRWCLYIRHKSQKAYDAMKDSGFISLPSSRTLYDYSHFLKSELGFQADVFKLVQSEARKHGLYTEGQEWKTNVGLLFDEIKIKEDLVYDKHSGELIGYCNLGDIGNQMLEFEHEKNKRKQELAKFVLVVMLRSVCSSLCFPLCAFATHSINTEFIYPIMWKTVSTVETQLNLRVLFFTCDGATPNRCFFNLHRVGHEEVVFRSMNPYNERDRHVYFISDVPHLLKTIRNNLSNSFSHNNTRKMWINGKDVSWYHIVRFFEEHCELNLYNPCPKLSRKHIHLAAFNYMKVNLAAQVISDSVANSIQDLYGPDTEETVKFLRMFNKFFDCLNVRSMWEGRNKRNANLSPYNSEDDQRLKFHYRRSYCLFG